MFSLTLTVYNVMDAWVVSGAIREQSEDRVVSSVATFHEQVILSDVWLEEDPTATMIEVIRQWSESTISH